LLKQVGIKGMKGFKYIMVEQNELDCPVLFPPWIEHDNMALKFRGKVLSAGFVAQNDLGEIYTHGKSTSLKVSSRPEDTEIIQKLFKWEL